MAKKIDLILVPTDFSFFSCEAFSWAALFAMKFDSKILILHVISEKDALELISIPGNPWDKVIQREDQNMIDSFLTCFVSDFGETLERKTLVAVGRAPDKIVDTAREKNAGMIVLSTIGRRGLSNVLMGSVAEKVVRMAPCPVFLVKPKDVELAELSFRHMNLRKEAVPILTNLANETEQTAYLIVLDRDEAFCLERVDARQCVNIMFLEVDLSMPLHIGAGPRVLLAHLPEKEIDRIIKDKGLPAWTKKSITDLSLLKEDLKTIRSQGYAVSYEDVTEGIAALGCPVRNSKNEVVAAISIAGPVSNHSEENFPNLINAVRNAASELTQRIVSEFPSSD